MDMKHRCKIQFSLQKCAVLPVTADPVHSLSGNAVDAELQADLLAAVAFFAKDMAVVPFVQDRTKNSVLADRDISGDNWDLSGIGLVELLSHNLL